MIYHSTHHEIPPDVRIKISNKALSRAKYVKYLGLLMDENLNWKYHINEPSKTIQNLLYAY